MARNESLTTNREAVLRLQRKNGWNDEKASSYYSQKFEPIKKETWRKWRWSHRKSKKVRKKKGACPKVRRICGNCKHHELQFTARCTRCAEEQNRTGVNRPQWKMKKEQETQDD